LIVENLRVGATYADAAEAAGVSYQTFRNWLTQGESARSGKFFEFFEACRRAEAEARVRFVRAIYQAADGGDWRAAMEFLKRRDRRNWGDAVDVTSAGKQITAPGSVDLSRLSKDELLSLEAIVEKASNGSEGAGAGGNSG
jgi:hypothetical protein